MKFLLTTIMLLLVLSVLTVGCQTSEKPIEQNPSETQIQTVGTEIMTVTKEQLKKVTPKMTYEEVIRILGHGKDIGSGLYVFQYKYTDGQQFTLNFGGWNGIINEEHYKKIRNIISK